MPLSSSSSPGSESSSTRNASHSAKEVGGRALPLPDQVLGGFLRNAGRCRNLGDGHSPVPHEIQQLIAHIAAGGRHAYEQVRDPPESAPLYSLTNGGCGTPSVYLRYTAIPLMRFIALLSAMMTLTLSSLNRGRRCVEEETCVSQKTAPNAPPTPVLPARRLPARYR